jgi:AraC family transcriptional regulator, glycine betaine-responsive activator
MTIQLDHLARFGFLTLPSYSMIAAANAIEALRMANRVAGTAAYSWQIVTLDGHAAAASNGLMLTPSAMLSAADRFDIVFVVGGIDVRNAVDRNVTAALRRLVREGIALGALCTGTFALAEARLLHGYRCAIHWENLDAIREEFPDVDFVEDFYCIDRDRITCTGGIAPLDLILHLITPRIGRTLAAGISEQFIVERIRDSKDRQRIPIAARLGGCHPAITQAASLMEANIEEPLTLEELARMTEVSQRQLQRLFHRSLGLTPAQYYVTLRLGRGRELLQQTAMPITSIAVACGFRSPAHFSKSYRATFGHPPSQERRPPEETGPVRASGRPGRLAAPTPK